MQLQPYRFWLGLLLVFCSEAVGVASAQSPTKPIRVGVIGLDTSHSIAFTKLLNDPNAESPLKECQVICAYPHGSADIESSVSRIPDYTRQVTEMGVEIVDSIETLIARVDVVLLETNDGRPHLEQVLPVLRAGKPVFVDKPCAASLVDVIAMFRVADHFGTPMFSSSSLRFAKPALAAREGMLVGNVLGGDTFSPAKLEPTHPDLFWYGIHGVEQLYTVMGSGCQTVTRTTTESTDLVVGTWDGGRIGTFRGTRSGPHEYGGTVFGEKGNAATGGNPGYQPMLVEIARFFQTGKSPIDARETIEIYAFMTAADKCKSEPAGRPVDVRQLIADAELQVEQRLQTMGIELKTK